MSFTWELIDTSGYSTGDTGIQISEALFVYVSGLKYDGTGLDNTRLLHITGTATVGSGSALDSIPSGPFYWSRGNDRWEATISFTDEDDHSKYTTGFSNWEWNSGATNAATGIEMDPAVSGITTFRNSGKVAWDRLSVSTDKIISNADSEHTHAGLGTGTTGAFQLDELQDVAVDGSIAYTDGKVLRADGDSYEEDWLNIADIPGLATWSGDYVDTSGDYVDTSGDYVTASGVLVSTSGILGDVSGDFVERLNNDIYSSLWANDTGHSATKHRIHERIETLTGVGEITTAVNTGGEAEVYNLKILTGLYLRTLKDGNEVHVTQNTATLEVSTVNSGWPYGTPATIGWDDGTRTLSLSGAPYDYWISGIRYNKTETQTIQIDDTEGSWFVYFTGSTLTGSQTPWSIKANDKAFVAYLIWDAENNEAVVNGYELHKYRMDSDTHNLLHGIIGTSYENGLGIGSLLSGDGNDNSGLRCSVDQGELHDEDIEIKITDGVGGGLWEQDLSYPAKLPILYRTGAQGNWRKFDATEYIVATGASPYPMWNSGDWSPQEATNLYYIAYWMFGTTCIHTPVKMVMGQREDSSLTVAKDNNTFENLNFGSDFFNEFRVLYRLIYRARSSYSNDARAALVDVQDLRGVSNVPGGTYVATDHNVLGGRSTYPTHPASSVSFDSGALTGNLEGVDDVQEALVVFDAFIGGVTHMTGLTGGAWSVFYSQEVSGLVTGLALGTSGYALMSEGTGVPPVWGSIPAGGMSDLVDDTSPQLGGDLDLNEFAVQGNSEDILEDLGEDIFKATYNFKDDADASEPDDWTSSNGAGCTTTVISDLGGHNKVFDLHDNGAGACQIEQVFSGAQAYGTVETYYRTDDVTAAASCQFRLHNAGNINFILGHGVNAANVFEYYNGAWISTGVTILVDTWYHIRIDYETTAGGYKGLANDTWQVYINGVLYGPYTMDSVNSPTKVLLYTSGADSGYHLFLDAIGYSWDANYDIGDNLILYEKFLKVNTIRTDSIVGTVKSLLNEDILEDLGTEMYKATYNFSTDADAANPAGWTINEDGGTVNVIASEDGHSKVVEMDDTDGGDHVELYQAISPGGLTGTIEFWIKFNQTNMWITNIIHDGSSAHAIYLAWEADGDIVYYDTAWRDVGNYVAGQWYHYRIEWDTADDWHLWIDGVSIDGGVGYAYRGTPTTMDTNFFSTDNATTGTLYIDGVGYSWDANYDIGDNLILYEKFLKVNTIRTDSIVGTVKSLLNEDILEDLGTDIFKATYNFKDDADAANPTDWTVVETAGTVNIISDIGIHKKVVEFNRGAGAGSAGMEQSFAAQTEGTIEFYWYVNSGDTFQIRLYSGATTATLVSDTGGNFQYYDGAYKDFDIPTVFNAGEWYHVRIYFDCVADTIDVWINGVLKTSGASFWNVVASIDKVYFNCWAVNTIAYIDAIGYSWDANYDIRDNLLYEKYLKVDSLKTDLLLVNDREIVLTPEQVYYVASDAELDAAIVDIEANNYDGRIIITEDLTNVQATLNDASASYIIEGSAPGITLDCNGDTSAFLVTNCGSLVIRNLTIDATDLTTAARPIIDINGGSNIIIDSVIFTGDGTNGYAVDCFVNGVRMINCNVTDVGKAWFSTGADHCIIAGNILTDLASYQINAVNSEYMIVANNIINGGNVPIRFENALCAVVSNNIINNSISSVNIQFFSGSSHCSFSNNVIRGAPGSGFWLDTITYCLFNSNVIVDCDSNSASAYAGFYLNGNVDYCSFVGNQCIDNNNAGAGVTYGIRIGNANCDWNLIGDCTLVGNDTNLSDVGTNTTTSNNIAP